MAAIDSSGNRLPQTEAGARQYLKDREHERTTWIQRLGRTLDRPWSIVKIIAVYTVVPAVAAAAPLAIPIGIAVVAGGGHQIWETRRARTRAFDRGKDRAEAFEQLRRELGNPNAFNSDYVLISHDDAVYKKGVAKLDRKQTKRSARISRTDRRVIGADQKGQVQAGPTVAVAQPQPTVPDPTLDQKIFGPEVVAEETAQSAPPVKRSTGRHRADGQAPPPPQSARASGGRHRADAASDTALAKVAGQARRTGKTMAENLAADASDARKAIDAKIEDVRAQKRETFRTRVAEHQAAETEIRDGLTGRELPERLRATRREARKLTETPDPNLMKDALNAVRVINERHTERANISDQGTVAVLGLSKNSLKKLLSPTNGEPTQQQQFLAAALIIHARTTETLKPNQMSPAAAASAATVTLAARELGARISESASLVAFQTHTGFTKSDIAAVTVARDVAAEGAGRRIDQAALPQQRGGGARVQGQGATL